MDGESRVRTPEEIEEELIASEFKSLSDDEKMDVLEEAVEISADTSFGPNGEFQRVGITAKHPINIRRQALRKANVQNLRIAIGLPGLDWNRQLHDGPRPRLYSSNT